MIEPTSIIFSHRKDDHLPAVLCHLGEDEFPFVVDVSDLGHTVAACISPGTARAPYLRLQSGEVVALSRLKSVWWRRPTQIAVDPATPANVRCFVHTERELFLSGFLASLPPAVRMYNDPHADDRVDSKVYQLHLAAEVGLPIPDTCITSDPHAARLFAQRHAQTVFKAFLASHEFWRPTQILTPQFADKLDHVLTCPVIFQEFIEGDCDLRVTVIDDEIHGVAFDLTKSRYPADVRIDPRTPSTPCEIEPSLQEKIREFMRRAGLRYGAFDFRRARDGTTRFFEINPAGEFVYLDRQAGTQIAASMARALSREAVCNANYAEAPGDLTDAEGWANVNPVPLAALGEEILHLP